MSTLIQLGKTPSSPTKVQEQEMFEKYFSLPMGTEKDKQRNFIASHYMYFVHYIVHKKRLVLADMPYEDRYQQGIIGLLDGIDKFDLSKGFRFTSYVSFYIFRACAKELETNETVVKLPGNMYFRMKKPDFSEKYRGMETYPVKSFSIDKVLQDETHTWLDCMTCPESEEDVFRGPTRHYQRKIITEVFSELKGVDATIMSLYYGYSNSGDTYKLVDIGEIVGLSKERVRQRRNNCIKKMQEKIAIKLQCKQSEVINTI